MSGRFHLFFIAGIFSWITLGFIFPPWKGVSYNPSDSSEIPQYWDRSGIFGLRDNSGLRPIWSPPMAAYIPSAKPKLRWPWEPPNHAYHVEISMALLVGWIGLGLVVFGISERIIAATWPPPTPDPVVTVAWTTAMGLVIGFLLVLVLAALSMLMLPESYAITLLIVAGAGGLANGAATVIRGRSR